MLIIITNSNSSPEVNSTEVSLKSQCEFCVHVRENIQNIFWEAELTCLCTHVFIYEFVPLENLHSKDELQSSLLMIIQVTNFSLVCKRSDHSKDELQSSLQ